MDKTLYDKARENYENGNYAEAFALYTQAADKGHASAQFYLGNMYAYGKGVEQDYAKAVEWWKRAAEQGISEAQYNLGVSYDNGKGVEQDYTKAVEWYKKAAEQGDASAQYNLGVRYDNGEGVEQDYTKAVEWWKKAAEQGDVSAQYNLGVMYYNGEGVEQDYTKAVEWYTKAAVQGDASAQYNLALKYDKGEGVEQDYAKAVEWYTKAAEQGNASAQYNLALKYDKGEGVEQDYTEAVKWYIRSAEQGDASAQFNLGVMYYNGEGVGQDFAETVKWFRRSAEQGDASAQYNLALMYYKGKGVEQDYTEAVKWYAKSAEQGEAKALCNLGNMHADGQGVETSLVKAIGYWTKAKEESGEAAYRLGYCYLLGEGLDQDIDKAEECFMLAKAKGYSCDYILNMVKAQLGKSSERNAMREMAEEISALAKRERYAYIVKSNTEDFGKEWDKLQKDTKSFMTTGMLAYIDFHEYGPEIYEKLDFTTAITPMIKSLETELSRYFFEGYIDYLKEKEIPYTDFSKERAFIFKDKDTNEALGYVDYTKGNFFTLGSFQHIVGVNQYLKASEKMIEKRKSISDFSTKVNLTRLYGGERENVKEEVFIDATMLDYADKLFKEDAFGEKYRRKEIEGYLIRLAAEIADIAFSLRNPAAHTVIMSVTQAESCGNYLFKVKKLMKELIEKIDV